MRKLLAVIMTSTLLWIAHATASPVVFFAPDCRPHIIHRYEEVSRDYTYLEFHRDKQPCQLKGIIGGEHQTFINVLGFAGDKYSVSLFEQAEHPSFTISGEGFKVSRSAENNEQIVEIEAMETFFSIEVYAYPYGKYKMIIRKL